MFSRSVVSAMVGGFALGAGVAVAVMAQAQPVTAGAPAALAPPALHAPAAACGPQVTALSADTFVTVKDGGDAQVVSVFKLDPQGINRLSHKAKFFY